MDRYEDANVEERLPEVYYRRRRLAAVVGLVVAAVIIAVVLGIMGKGSPTNTDPVVDRTSATTTSAAAQSNTSSTSSEDPTTEQSSSTKETETDSATSTTTEPVTCGLSDLVVTASSSQSSYSEGQAPIFYMSVANPTGADCAIDLDQDVMRFEVYDLSNNQRIWSDTDCHDSIEVGEHDFEAGTTANFKAEWSRTSSEPTCEAERTYVPAGGYYVHAVIGNNASEPVTFNLR